jgi:hypothetical protein
MFTPLHIKLLLHYHTNPVPFSNSHSPAVRDFTDDLILYKLVEKLSEPNQHGGCYVTTLMGNAYVRAICSVPLPEQRWVSPAQDERTL